MSSKPTDPMNYQKAGVDIEAGNRLVERIKPIAASTHGPEVLSGLGGFAAPFALAKDDYQEPILVSATDGVGTKLKLALQTNRHDTIGIDLVAMCVNDLIVCAAKPLFFLDYYATAHLHVETATSVISGIAEGCKQAGAALIGGETAEMPGMYHGEDYDLAGFCVGVVDKKNMINGDTVVSGDALIGLASSGPHSNGYSLIRKIIETRSIDLGEAFQGKPLIDHLLAPTKIYVKSILTLLETQNIKAMAHITGGGLIENLPRVLPDNAAAIIHKNAYTKPAIFDWLQEQGNIADHDMQLTFNNGIGMVIFVPQDDVDACLQSLENSGEKAWHIGEIIEATNSNNRVTLQE